MLSPTMLGQQPPAGTASTIYASPTVPPGAGTYPVLPQHQLPQSAAAPPVLRRGPKRAARGDEPGPAPGESPSLWSRNPAPANGAEKTAEAATATTRLGASARDRDQDRGRDRGRADSSTASPTAEPPRKKQKRNKPTLSCFECVERKTKACAIDR